jgi:hypothetical protein
MQGLRDPMTLRKKLGVYDLIQGEMNGGYAIGGMRQDSDEKVILFDNVQSDGSTVSFGDYGPGMRDSNWKRWEYLEMHKVTFGERADHAYLEALAAERGYRVELVD